MRKLFHLGTVGFLLLAGCALHRHPDSANVRAARLAQAQQQVVRLNDPVARSRAFNNIADLTLDFAFQAANDGDMDRMGRLLRDYDSAIHGSRDSLLQSPQKLKPSSYRDLEIALRSQIRRLKYLSDSVTFEQREPVAAALQDASDIRIEIFRVLFPKVALDR